MLSHAAQPHIKENNHKRQEDLSKVYEAAFGINHPGSPEIGEELRKRILTLKVYGKHAAEHLPSTQKDDFLGKMSSANTSLLVAKELVATKRQAYLAEKRLSNAMKKLKM